MSFNLRGLARHEPCALRPQRARGQPRGRKGTAAARRPAAVHGVRRTMLYYGDEGGDQRAGPERHTATRTTARRTHGLTRAATSVRMGRRTRGCSPTTRGSASCGGLAAGIAHRSGRDALHRPEHLRVRACRGAEQGVVVVLNKADREATATIPSRASTRAATCRIGCAAERSRWGARECALTVYGPQRPRARRNALAACGVEAPVVGRPLDESDLIGRAKRGDKHATRSSCTHTRHRFRTAYVIAGTARTPKRRRRTDSSRRGARSRVSGEGAPFRPCCCRSSRTRHGIVVARRADARTLLCGRRRRSPGARPRPPRWHCSRPSSASGCSPW